MERNFFEFSCNIIRMTCRDGDYKKYSRGKTWPKQLAWVPSQGRKVDIDTYITPYLL